MTAQLDEIRFRGTVANSDWRRAAWLLLRPRPSLAILGVLIGCMAVGALALSLRMALRYGGSVREFTLFLWGAVTYSVTTVVLAWRGHLGTFRRLEPWLCDQDFRVDAIGLFGTTRFGRLDLPWSFVRSWHEYEEMFVLRFAPGVFAPVPKRFFTSADEIARFRAIAQGRVGKAP